MRQAQYTEVSLPEFGFAGPEPMLSPGLYLKRHAELLRHMTEHKLDAVVIYGDREHVANISWATGYDPRFEEALYIVVPNRKPALLAGNEGYPYTELAQGHFDRVLWQQLSLMGQPRDKDKGLADLLEQAGLKLGMKIGLAGWKGFETEQGAFDGNWFETPHYLVEALRRFGSVSNAAQIFMHPTTGLRVINEAAQLMRFEYASCLSSTAIKNFVLGAKPGISEYDACRSLNLNGFPHSTHINMCSGPRAKYGLPSPSERIIEQGDPIVIGHGLMGSLNCRAGFMVANASELPPPISDYVEKLVMPYFRSAVAWYETIGIGVEGSAVFDAVMAHVSDPFFGIGLNPGHLIHLDEWVNSPIKKKSKMKFVSGMALQCDIIPATGTDYFMSNIEDGIALADAEMRAELKQNYPDAWARIETRRHFMIDVLGIRLKPEILPFSNIAAWLPPFWLAPHKAMVMR